MTEPYSHRLRTDRLGRGATEVEAAPDADARARIAAALDLLGLPEAHLAGRIVPAPAGALALEARLTARAVQACGVTLAPVPAAIDAAVRRVWSPHAGETTAEGEVEMGDPDLEPLGAEIDLGAVLVEALSLELPDFPRAEGVSLGPADDTPEGTRRPFAGLAEMLSRKT